MWGQGGHMGRAVPAFEATSEADAAMGLSFCPLNSLFLYPGAEWEAAPEKSLLSLSLARRYLKSPDAFTSKETRAAKAGLDSTEKRKASKHNPIPAGNFAFATRWQRHNKDGSRVCRRSTDGGGPMAGVAHLTEFTGPEGQGAMP